MPIKVKAEVTGTYILLLGICATTSIAQKSLLGCQCFVKELKRTTSFSEVYAKLRLREMGRVL